MAGLQISWIFIWWNQIFDCCLSAQVRAIWIIISEWRKYYCSCLLGGIFYIESDLIFSIWPLLAQFSEIKATFKTQFFEERRTKCQEVFIFNWGSKTSRDPYQNYPYQVFFLCHISPSLICGSSGDNFSEKSERVTFLAFEVANFLFCR